MKKAIITLTSCFWIQ